VSVNTHCNEAGFHKCGKSYVQETVRLVHSQGQHKETFSAVLSKHLESTTCSAIDEVFNKFVSKVTNTGIFRFI